MPNLMMDLNIYDHMERESIDTNDIRSVLESNNLTNYLCRYHIEESVLLNSSYRVSKRLSLLCALSNNNVLKDSKYLEVREVLSYLSAKHADDVISSSYDASIFGDGKSDADSNLSNFGRFKGVVLINGVVWRIQRTKIINQYLQNLWKYEPHLWHTNDLATEKGVREYFASLDSLYTDIDHMSILDIEDAIKNIRKKPVSKEWSEWEKTNDAKKASIITDLAKRHFMQEFLYPMIIRRLPQEHSSEMLVNELKCESDFLKAVGIIGKIDFYHIPSYWTSIAVALLQELRKIKDSNTFDQGYTAYFKSIDYFITADGPYYGLLMTDTNVLKDYFAKIGIKTRIIFLDKNKDDIVTLLRGL